MRYVDEFRDGAAARGLAAALARETTRPWTLMEVCGGQTHAIVKYGLDTLLPEGVTLIHGPGCPVCVTPVETVDRAVALAGQPGVTFCSFGDMLRVPGTGKDLLSVKAEGGDVRMVYSPLDAVALAQRHPEREVVFFGVGFETTAAPNAGAVHAAARAGLKNFSMLVSQVRVPPAIEAILSAPGNRVQAFLAAGHVCTVMGTSEYDPLARRHGVPIVATGFEPLDILQGVRMSVAQLESGRAEVEIQYTRSVRPEGNPAARRLLAEVFEVADKKWRGLGTIPASGLVLREAYAAFDAERRFGLLSITAEESPECHSGEVLMGAIRPPQCPAFGTRCTPERPLGAPMVSSEGACAAYFRYRRPTQ